MSMKRLRKYGARVPGILAPESGSRPPSPRPQAEPRPEPSPRPQAQPIPATPLEPRPSTAPRPEAHIPRPHRPMPEGLPNPRTTVSYLPPGPLPPRKPGPPPALGRPEALPRDHGAWKNRSCFSRGSKNWKPDIMSLGDAHNCCPPDGKGPQSPNRPPNISGGQGGYNGKLFPDERSVAGALKKLGYVGSNGNDLLGKFQRHWNGVVSSIRHSPRKWDINAFAEKPTGLLMVDGVIGPHTLNAIEIALFNQNSDASMRWVDVVDFSATYGNGYGRRNKYNAAEGYK